jgi:hypothetical protein
VDYIRNTGTPLSMDYNHNAGTPLSVDYIQVLNATFNNISVILWRSVLLVAETGVPGENHRSARKSLTNFIT